MRRWMMIAVLVLTACGSAEPTDVPQAAAPVATSTALVNPTSTLSPIPTIEPTANPSPTKKPAPSATAKASAPTDRLGVGRDVIQRMFESEYGLRFGKEQTADNGITNISANDPLNNIDIFLSGEPDALYRAIITFEAEAGNDSATMAFLKYTTSLLEEVSPSLGPGEGGVWFEPHLSAGLENELEITEIDNVEVAVMGIKDKGQIIVTFGPLEK